MRLPELDHEAKKLEKNKFRARFNIHNGLYLDIIKNKEDKVPQIHFCFIDANGNYSLPIPQYSALGFLELMIDDSKKDSNVLVIDNRGLSLAQKISDQDIELAYRMSSKIPIHINNLEGLCQNITPELGQTYIEAIEDADKADSTIISGVHVYLKEMRLDFHGEENMGILYCLRKVNELKLYAEKYITWSIMEQLSDKYAQDLLDDASWLQKTGEGKLATKIKELSEFYKWIALKAKYCGPRMKGLFYTLANFCVENKLINDVPDIQELKNRTINAILKYRRDKSSEIPYDKQYQVIPIVAAPASSS